MPRAASPCTPPVIPWASGSHFWCRNCWPSPGAGVGRLPSPLWGPCTWLWSLGKWPHGNRLWCPVTCWTFVPFCAIDRPWLTSWLMAHIALNCMDSEPGLWRFGRLWSHVIRGYNCLTPCGSALWPLCWPCLRAFWAMNCVCALADNVH